MKKVSYLQKNALDYYFTGIDVEELIIGHQNLSRFGDHDLKSLEVAAQECLKRGIQPVLEWDALFTEDHFQHAVEICSKINLNLFSAIRVQDPGVLEYVLEKTSLPIQFVAETGNHNLNGLKCWENYIGKRLQRLVLSLELSFEKIKEYKQSLKTPIELLGLGRLLIFYTPRGLLSPVFDKQLESKTIELSGKSEESPHKGFPIVENSSGTFMFYPKDHCLLSEISQLEDIDLDWIRFDFRWQNQSNIVDATADYLKDPSPENFRTFKSIYPVGLIQGFFHINKSDKQFSKLKNHRLQNRGDNYLGEILEVKRDKYLALMLKNPLLKLKRGDRIGIETPEGKLREMEVQFTENTTREEIDEAINGDLALINYHGGVTVKSSVYSLST